MRSATVHAQLPSQQALRAIPSNVGDVSESSSLAISGSEDRIP
jgi:hypothetical protein